MRRRTALFGLVASCACLIWMAAGCLKADPVPGAPADATSMSDADPASGDTPSGGDTENPTEDPCPPVDFAFCSGRCINIQSNIEHCGKCGRDCRDLAQNPACAHPSCTNGSCQLAAADEGTACTLEDGTPGVCTSGTCVECLSAEDCTDPPNDYDECWAASCSTSRRCSYSIADPDTKCGTKSCARGVTTLPKSCGSEGNCSTGGGTIPCDPYTCDDSGVECRTSCSSPEHCTGDATCQDGTCQSN